MRLGLGLGILRGGGTKASPVVSNIVFDEGTGALTFTASEPGTVTMMVDGAGSSYVNWAAFLAAQGSADVLDTVAVVNGANNTTLDLSSLATGTYRLHIDLLAGGVHSTDGGGTSSAFDWTAIGFAVNEGTSTATFSTSGGYRIATMTNGQTLVVTGAGKPAGVLVQAGGGGGGGRRGGGGAGAWPEILTGASAPDLTVQTYTATVGTGGTAGNNITASGDGGDSVFAGITSKGGRGGAMLSASDGRAGQTGSTSGNSNGSGGASNVSGSGTATGGAAQGSGYAGGAGSTIGSTSGGGGGAGGAGTAADNATGGPGIASPVPGETAYYGAGGGGYSTVGGQGLGGNSGSTGAGGNSQATGGTAATAGANGYGSGGGGGNDASGQRAGAAGGNGTVKVWWVI